MIKKAEIAKFIHEQELEHDSETKDGKINFPILKRGKSSIGTLNEPPKIKTQNAVI